MYSLLLRDKEILEYGVPEQNQSFDWNISNIRYIYFTSVKKLNFNFNSILFHFIFILLLPWLQNCIPWYIKSTHDILDGRMVIKNTLNV